MGIFSLAVLFGSFSAMGQAARPVKGTVLDAQKNPLVGVSVQVKETSTTTRTDGGGRFSILVPPHKHLLLVTYVGKASQEVNIRNEDIVSIIMKDQRRP
ncbi:MAG TPA: carboxypeptidase-like regulatory domain-containing protein [Puia sp.]|nr:carboxypeptidase-like regulatory domain-containing protein [Puia sp.]